MATKTLYDRTLESSGLRLKLTWAVTSQNIVKNTSTVDVKVYLEYNTYHIIVNSGSYMEFMGQKVDIAIYTSPSYTTSEWRSVLVGSKTFTVNHNTDGTKSGKIAAAVSGISFFPTGSGFSLAINSTDSLAKIPRATQPTLNSTSTVMGGDGITIYTPRKTPSFKHTLTYKFGNATGTIATGVTTATSEPWVPPVSLASQVPDSVSGTCIITCKTYLGSDLVGTKTVSITLTVPSSVWPNISKIDTTDDNGYLTKYGYYVQNKSACTIKVTASGSYGSTIKAYKIKIGGVTYSGSEYTTGLLSSAGDNTITVTVTDSRGRSTTSTKTITVLAYTKPTISTLTAVRCDSDGTENPDGAYIKINLIGSITPLNQKNSKSFVIEYKKSTDTSWTPVTEYTSGYGLNTTRIVEASTESYYIVMATLVDDFATVSRSVDVGSAFTLIDFRNTGKGIAFGMVSTKDAFQCGLIAEFLKNIRMSPDSNDEKNIYFYNAGNGTYAHNSRIFGGSGTSPYGIGAYDTPEQKYIWAYNTATGKLRADALIQNHCIVAYKNTATTLSSTSETKITLNTIYTESDTAGILAISDGGILCGADGLLEVSGSIGYTGLAAGNTTFCTIKKGSTTVAQGKATPHFTQLIVGCTPQIISVSAGDIIYLYAQNSTAAQGTISQYVSNTRLTAKYVA